MLFTLLMGSLLVWYRTLGSVAVDTVSSPKSEMFYWVMIMFSQTLGTALDDWTADTAGLGYGGGAMVFSAMLAILAVAYYRTTISRTTLFWAAFILTRPLGAVVGDFLDKPISQGGLESPRLCGAQHIGALGKNSRVGFPRLQLPRATVRAFVQVKQA
jgi:uncharacterized membrane-anchored protein